MVHTNRRFFYIKHTPYTPPPSFIHYICLLGLFPPQTVHLLPPPDMKWGMYSL